MNQLSLDCGDTNECQEEIFTVDFQYIIRFVMYLALAAEFWSIDHFSRSWSFTGQPGPLKISQTAIYLEIKTSIAFGPYTFGHSIAA